MTAMILTIGALVKRSASTQTKIRAVTMVASQYKVLPTFIRVYSALEVTLFRSPKRRDPRANMHVISRRLSGGFPVAHINPLSLDNHCDYRHRLQFTDVLSKI